jgi:ribosomal protein S18 acetylase RimI-like enzyme
MKRVEVDVKIRRMTEADLPKVKEIDRLLAGQYGSVSWPLRVEAHWWVYRGMPNFVAEVEGGVVGFIMGDIRGVEYGADTSGWIDMIGVLPEHQSRGIGRRLAEEFSRECERRGVKVRVLAVGEDKRIVKFWTSLGFRKGRLVSYQR